MSLYNHAERVPSTGAMHARGMKSALGRPSMNRWALLVREAVQNSWDARAARASGPVRFVLDLRQPTPEQHEALRELVFSDRGPVMGSDFWKRLDRRPQWFLTVHDRGTTGLCGPERADEIGPSNNFSDFVWNFGAGKDQDHAGGTYGYGRSVFFSVGQPEGAGGSAAIVVYSRYRDGSRVRSRLIAMGLASDVQREWTGRNWWGRQPSEGFPTGPVEDGDADTLADLLGLPCFAPAETGTTILVPCCDLGEPGKESEQDPEEAAMAEMADAVLWHCWPKLVDFGKGPEMRFSFTVNGKTIPVPRPEQHPEIGHFVDCLRRCSRSLALADLVDEDDSFKGPSSRTARVRSLKPKKDLGVLSLKRFFVEPLGQSPDSPARPFVGDLHHTALMRTPKLIVKYLPGPESPIPNTRWAGVFVADEGVDKTFADSEPPPHDDWVVTPGAKFKANLVKIGLRRIEETVKAFTAPPPSEPVDEGGPLGKVADALGDLLVGGPEDGPGGDLPPPPPPGPPRARLRQREPSLSYENGLRRLYVPFTVDAKPGTPQTRVTANVGVAINDGSSSEKDPPTGLSQPELQGFQTPEGTLRNNTTAEIEATDKGEWCAVVNLPPDVAVRVVLRAE